jgi:hypothetical protein
MDSGIAECFSRGDFLRAKEKALALLQDQTQKSGDRDPHTLTLTHNLGVCMVKIGEF